MSEESKPTEEMEFQQNSEDERLDASAQIQKFQEFFSESYNDEIIEAFHNGKSYLDVDFSKVAMFEPKLADILLDEPDEVLKASEIALEYFDIPESIGKMRVRLFNLPESQGIMIRNIRSKHINKFFFTNGLVRQKSDVRPQVTSARFECPSCGNILSVLQLDSKFKEPTRCGCGRKGKFRLLSKELVDAQGIVLEEAPEELVGGEQPKRINLFLTNDLVSPMSEKKTNPGTKIKVVGTVKEVPITLRDGAQSTRFDLMIEVNSISTIEEDYSEITISEEEEKQIKDIAKNPKFLENMVGSVAPSIYGHSLIKEALLLQMVGGVQKKHDDGVITRGDIHVLLIGDPGAGKCLHGDTKIMLESGEIIPIRSIVQNNLFMGEQKKIENLHLPTLNLNGRIGKGNAVRVWNRKIKENLLEINTRTGKRLIITKNHPLFTLHSGFIIAKTAEEFKKGNRIATPRFIDVTGSIQTLPAYQPITKAPNVKKHEYPDIVTPQLSRLLGYLTGDGYVAYSQTSGWVSLTNNDENVLIDYVCLLKTLFNAKATKRTAHKEKTAQKAYISSKNIVNYLFNNFPELEGGAKNKTIPSKILQSSNKVLAQYFRGLFECDSHVNVNKKQIEFCTISKDLAEKIQLALLRFGIVSLLKNKIKHATNTLLKRKTQSYDLIISGMFVKKYSQHIGFISKRKNSALNQLISKTTIYNTNIDLVPNVDQLLKAIRIENNLTQSEMGLVRSTYAHFEQKNRLPSQSILQKISASLKKRNIESFHTKVLNQISNADIFWDEILEIKEIESEDQYVYDLEVNATHNYVANGVVVHNSQMLKRINVVAPKARFIGGKGVSGAGLTASVVKDEFLKGWALEAGALVLANKGICCIDELDKISPDDRNAMHEALEQQSVTISKANIQATLRAETTVLAAANPKFGRFDPYETIAKQIDLPVTLINRFDLIFAIRDLPDKVRDENMATFILSLHQNSLNKDPAIETPLLKKYIAYAKQTKKPVITDAALAELKNYYIKMRGSNSGETEVKAIPISARQLEALIRLTEAAAKLRLSEKAQKKDAKKAIELLNYCLNQVGIDPETGKIDIDRISTGVPASERSKIVQIREIIAELENSLGKTILLDDIVREATENNISEEAVEEAIEKLKRSGDIFEPRAGFISRI